MNASPSIKDKTYFSNQFDGQLVGHNLFEIALLNLEWSSKSDLNVGLFQAQVKKLLVNNSEIKAFIDSGAQATIMSQACAEKCNLMHLVDRRYAGIAVGVGTAKFLGRVHAAYFQVGTEMIQASINIIEGSNKPDFIFGLDMLRRHQCQIDLKNNQLVFGYQDIRIPFLSEHEAQDEFLFQREQLAKQQSQSKSLDEATTTITGKPTLNGLPLSQTTSSAPSQTRQGSQAPFNMQQSQQSQQEQMKQYQNQQRQNMTQSQAQQQSQGSISNDKIQTLVNLGFSREQSVQALQACRGNVDMAAAMLFQ